MNRRQRKKKDTKGLTLIFSCEMVYKLVGTRKGNKKRRRSVCRLGLLPKRTLQRKRIYRRRDSNRL